MLLLICCYISVYTILLYPRFIYKTVQLTIKTTILVKPCSVANRRACIFFIRALLSLPLPAQDTFTVRLNIRNTASPKRGVNSRKASFRCPHRKPLYSQNDIITCNGFNNICVDNLEIGKQYFGLVVKN